MTLDVGQVYVWAVTGMLLGFVVARMVRGWGLRTTTNAAIGLFSGIGGGALVWYLSRFVEDLPLVRFTFSPVDIVAAAVTAVIVLIVLQYIWRSN